MQAPEYDPTDFGSEDLLRFDDEPEVITGFVCECEQLRSLVERLRRVTKVPRGNSRVIAVLDEIHDLAHWPDTQAKSALHAIREMLAVVMPRRERRDA